MKKLLFSAFFALLSLKAEQSPHLQAFSAIKGFENIFVFIPQNCSAKNSFGDMILTCQNHAKITAQVLNIEIGCFEAARTLIDLNGADPRGLTATKINGEKLELRLPIFKGALLLYFEPASAKSEQTNIVICDKGAALSIFGDNEELVKEVARNSKIN